MVRLFARRSPRRKPLPTGKYEPAGPVLTEGNNTYTLAPAMSFAPTPIPASAPALPLAPAPVDADATVRYLEADLERILRTVLEARLLAPTLTPKPLLFPDGSCERPLKASFPELYCGKTHMECYKFIQ